MKRDELKVWYEPHPVSAERKAELRAKGFRIIDQRFMPHDYRPPEVAKAGTPTADFDGMTKAELLDFADGLGVEGVSASMRVGEIRDLVKAACDG